MKLSTKGRYAVTAMMDLALNDTSGPVALSEISNYQGISLSYLEQLFAKLRKVGLVEGVRGPGGGYRLGKPVNQITIAEIILAVDESIDSTQCKGTEDCHAGDRCMTHQLWEDLSFRLYEFLNGITLSDFIQRPEVKRISVDQNATSAHINNMFQPVIN
ncbi:Rrf2 family transcriptional regulator [Leucothrix sargassi]|nr:Rrf2 family transcriptional regulator [Leucothrix sargassi]